MLTAGDWLADLDVPVLAGSAGADRCVNDLYFLSHHIDWNNKDVQDELADKAVVVPASVLPGHDVRFDILVKSAARAGAACIVYLGGKRSDFPKGTLLLADQLPLCLAWVADANAYVTLIRAFYRRLTGMERRLVQGLEEVRERIEEERAHVTTLAAWLALVERELQVTCTLEPRLPSIRRTVWVRRDGKPVLHIPIRASGMDMCLTVRPKDTCSLYQSSAEAAWIVHLASLLSAGTEGVLWREAVGAHGPLGWSLSFEAAVFALVSNIPAMSIRWPLQTQVHEDMPKLVGAYSLARRLHILPLQGIAAVYAMWLTAVDPPSCGQAEAEALLLTPIPHPYRFYRLSTLLLRDYALEAASQPQLRCYLEPDKVACVPWRDWRGREGIVVVWGVLEQQDVRAEEVVRAWLHDLEVRLRRPLTGVACGMDVGDVTPQAVMGTVQKVMDAGLQHFLRLPDGVYGVRFLSQAGDSVLLLDAVRADAAEEAMRILEPILRDKSADALLEALRAYIDSGGRLQLAAQSLYVHRNTIRYRLRRIEELTGARITDAQTRMTFQIALRLWQMFRLHRPQEDPDTQA